MDEDVKLLSRPGSPIILVFDPERLYPIPRETPSAGAQSTLGWGKFDIFDLNRRLSLKRFDKANCCFGTLLGSHRWQIDLCPLWWPQVTLKCGTRGSNFQADLHNNVHTVRVHTSEDHPINYVRPNRTVQTCRFHKRAYIVSPSRLWDACGTLMVKFIAEISNNCFFLASGP